MTDYESVETRLAILEIKMDDCQNIGNGLMECISRLSTVESRGLSVQVAVDRLSEAVDELTKTVIKHKYILGVVVWAAGMACGAAITVLVTKIIGS